MDTMDKMRLGRLKAIEDMATNYHIDVVGVMVAVDKNEIAPIRALEKLAKLAKSHAGKVKGQLKGVT